MKTMMAVNEIKKDPPLLIGLISLTWLRYPWTRGFAKHHIVNVTIFADLTK